MISKPAPEPTASEGPCFEHLRVIDDPVPRSGPVNMALDELLLTEAHDGLPLLRFYRWMRPTVSFGYFEPVDAARRLAGDRAVVRRMTGGGLVEHGDDLTYTIVVPRPVPFVNLRSAETYRLIHAAVALALARAGLPAEPCFESGKPIAPAEFNACFQRPVLHDLLAGGRKIAGGAQRRTRAGLLHQGSIHLAGTDGAAWMDAVQRNLPATLACHCDDRMLTAEEITRASDLASAKYAAASWTDRL